MNNLQQSNYELELYVTKTLLVTIRSWKKVYCKLKWMTPTTKGFHLFEDADYQKKYTSITIKDTYNILEYYGSLNENKHDNFFVLNDTYVFKCPNAKIRRYWISQIIKTPINPTDHNNFRLVTDTNTTINNSNSTNNHSRFNAKEMYTGIGDDGIKYTFIQQSETDEAG